MTKLDNDIIATVAILLTGFLFFLFALYVAGSIRVNGKPCNYVQINWRFQISVEGCKP